MKYDRARVLWSLSIGVFLTLPMLFVYVFGDGMSELPVEEVARFLATPAIILETPLLFLAPLVEDPDRYVLGTFFYSIPFVNAAFYAFCAYAILPLIHKKK